MDIDDFNKQEQEALLDLVVLGMYADSHLTSSEEATVQEILAAMGVKPGYDREREFDASVTRVRKHTSTAEAARAHGVNLARSFTSSPHRRQVADVLDRVLASDGEASPRETQFLNAVKTALEL
jgi:uncharacterized tellurite resistance protein B-like protein